MTRPSDRRQPRLDVYYRPNAPRAHFVQPCWRPWRWCCERRWCRRRDLEPTGSTVVQYYYIQIERCTARITRCIVQRCYVQWESIHRRVHSVGGGARWSSTEPVRCRPTQTCRYTSSVYDCWAAAVVVVVSVGGCGEEGVTLCGCVTYIGGPAESVPMTFCSIR